MHPADPSAATSEARRLFGMAVQRRERFGEYLLLGWIGAGATANVYRARHDGEDEIVALKIMRDAYAATPAELRRFRAGAAAAATLDHRHVVRVKDYGERGEEPFVAMELIAGGTLHDRLAGAPLGPDEATALMLTITEAVAHAHDRGIVHRDLKPANILVDHAGQPHVADFGLAKRVDHEVSFGGSLVPGAMVGAPAYMAPEVIDAGASADGVGTLPLAADVFSLGVVYYQLLTGRMPFVGRSVDELFDEIRGGDPVLPRDVNAGVNSSYQDVCMKCLTKAPANRYHSARALADDLERAMTRQPTIARPPTLWQRARRVIRRHPRVAAALAAFALVATIAGATAGLAWRAAARERSRALQTNAFIASGQAGALLFQLRTYSDRVERAARQAVVRTLLETGAKVDPAPQLAPLSEGFDSVYVETMQGRILAQWPSPAIEVFERQFAFRDYFRGAQRLAEGRVPGAYVSRAFKSESHHSTEFAISAPVLDDNGRQLGMLAAALRAREAFGAVRMHTGSESISDGEHITTALIGPRGGDRGEAPDGPMPTRYTFLVHPGLKRGASHALATPAPQQLLQAFGPPAPAGGQLTLDSVRPLEVADYRDPIPGFEGRWLAAFAPVGRTGFVVLVETRRPDSVRWPAALTPPIALPIMGALAVLVLLGLGVPTVPWRWRSRRAPGPHPPRSAARTR